MKLRSSADLAELEQKVVGFTDPSHTCHDRARQADCAPLIDIASRKRFDRSSEVVECAARAHLLSCRNKASTCPVLVYEPGTRVFGRMSVISLRNL
jgi:hypothetical protein